MTTAAETRLIERAAQLAIRKPEGASIRTWQVASATTPGRWYIVRGTVGDSFDAITCSCQGAKGRCAHRVRLAQFLGVEVPAPADKAFQPSPPSGVSVAGASVPATGRRGDHDTGEWPMPQEGGNRIVWSGSITDRATAIQFSGAIEGGGRVTLDIPDDGRAADIMRDLVAARRRSLRITIEVN